MKKEEKQISLLFSNHFVSLPFILKEAHWRVDHHTPNVLSFLGDQKVSGDF